LKSGSTRKKRPVTRHKYKHDDDDDDDDTKIDHIISASPILVKEQYIKKHNSVCAQHMQGNRGKIRQTTLV
jgi:hypothetical protein